jgi:hypothetical protein
VCSLSVGVGVGDSLGLFMTSDILARERGGVVERCLSTTILSSSLPGDADDVGEIVAMGGNAIPLPIGRGWGGRTEGRGGGGLVCL